MANNRMYLKNESTSKEVLIAKYYPSAGWKVFHDDIADKMDDLFDDDQSATLYGRTDWRIVYETEAE